MSTDPSLRDVCAFKLSLCVAWLVRATSRVALTLAAALPQTSAHFVADAWTRLWLPLPSSRGGLRALREQHAWERVLHSIAESDRKERLGES